jgi:3-hydroxyacyl-CoA dehydrogenase
VHQPLLEPSLTQLPGYLGNSATQDTIKALISSRKLQIVSDLKDAVKNATIIQEQGPENTPFKQKIWPEIDQYAPRDALLWSSTSGIPASLQFLHMTDKTRLHVVHPYNPPHIMPLIEIVPSPDTNPELVKRTEDYWKGIGREPVVLHKEVTGFVANRLAFVLLREAIHLVSSGVISVPDLDRLVESSMGPRWAVAGPFKSYHMGGGAGGLEGFMKNIGGTVQGCWDDAGREKVGDGWEGEVFRQTNEAYGEVRTGMFAERDGITREVIAVTEKRKGSESKSS